MYNYVYLCFTYDRNIFAQVSRLYYDDVSCFIGAIFDILRRQC